MRHKLKLKDMATKKIDGAIYDFIRSTRHNEWTSFAQIADCAPFTRWAIRRSLAKQVRMKHLLECRQASQKKTWKVNEDWCRIKEEDPEIQRIYKESHRKWLKERFEHRKRGKIMDHGCDYCRRDAGALHDIFYQGYHIKVCLRCKNDHWKDLCTAEDLQAYAQADLAEAKKYARRHAQEKEGNEWEGDLDLFLGDKIRCFIQAKLIDPRVLALGIVPLRLPLQDFSDPTYISFKSLVIDLKDGLVIVNETITQDDVRPKETPAREIHQVQ